MSGIVSDSWECMYRISAGCQGVHDNSRQRCEIVTNIWWASLDLGPRYRQTLTYKRPSHIFPSTFNHETIYPSCQPRNTTTKCGMMSTVIVAVSALVSGSSLCTLQEAFLARLPSLPTATALFAPKTAILTFIPTAETMTLNG